MLSNLKLISFSTKDYHSIFLRAILFEFACPQSVPYCRRKILLLNFLRHFTRIYMPTISVLLSSQNPAIEFLYVILLEFTCPQSVSYCRHKILPLSFLRHFTRIYMPTFSVLLSSQNPATEFFTSLYSNLHAHNLSYCRHRILPLNFVRHFTRIYMHTISVQKISFSIAIPKYTMHSCFFYTDIQLSYLFLDVSIFSFFKRIRQRLGNSILSLPQVKVYHLLTLV